MGSINQAQWKRYHCRATVVVSLWVMQPYRLLVICPEVSQICFSVLRDAWELVGCAEAAGKGKVPVWSPVPLTEYNWIL